VVGFGVLGARLELVARAEKMALPDLPLDSGQVALSLDGRMVHRVLTWSAIGPEQHLQASGAECDDGGWMRR
jgi:hypothetical protein